MKIENDLVVSIHFSVHDADGAELGTTEGGAPLDYIQGRMFLVPPLEGELDGKEVG